MRSGLRLLSAEAAELGEYFVSSDHAWRRLASPIPHSTAQHSALATLGSSGFASDLIFMTWTLCSFSSAVEGGAGGGAGGGDAGVLAASLLFNMSSASLVDPAGVATGSRLVLSTCFGMVNLSFPA